MSTSILNDDWVLCPDPNIDTLTWTKSLSRSCLSTADELGLHCAIQQLKLERLHVEDLKEMEFIASGETFAVSKCTFNSKTVAIKQIQFKDDGEDLNRRHFQHRLQSVLREVLIMCHPPLAYHPNIISFFGYGWTVEAQGPSPFVSVEFATMGSLRDYMEMGHSIRTKLILMGDVGAGLMALHSCGIVHGDLKLDNVLVLNSLERPSGSIAKVSDFGHSILVGSAPENQTHYFGTALYNAPEVATQRLQPITAEMLHKCDIWSFGICAWEILADGQAYFRIKDQNGSFCGRPLSCSDSWTLVRPAASDTAHSGHEFDADSRSPLTHFDHSHIRLLAIDFVNRMSIRGSIGIEKAFLRPLMERTLQPDPLDRISDLTRLPIMGFWNKASGGHSLQATLAPYALSAELRYSMFNRENKLCIIWEQQQRLLREFEIESETQQTKKDRGSAVFQTMLCYINAFGTSKDLTKATQLFYKAETAGHLIVQILGPRLRDGLSLNSSELDRSYSDCISLGFDITQNANLSAGISINIQESMTNFVDYGAFRQAFLLDAEVFNDDDTLISFEGSSTRHHPLEFAIYHGDLQLVDKMLSGLDYLSGAKHGKDSFIEKAASRGNGPILNRLLETKPTLRRKELTTIFHWLFRFDDSSLRGISFHLQEWINDSDFKSALSTPTSQGITMHPQWPFRIHGTPLATAISCGSISAVRTLLELNADPLAPCFNADDDDYASGLTPIHLAVRYHQPYIVRMLWKSGFGEKPIGIHLRRASTLGQYPVACALSFMSTAERLAIHGGGYREKLRDTIELFCMDNVVQTATKGQNAVMQAIDLEDADTVELLFERWPALAGTEFFNPDNRALFTYPLHFAVEIGSGRDTEESVHIVRTILKRDSTIISRLDRSSACCSVRPIHIAAKGLSSRILEFLLQCGASVQDLDETGQGPLHFCRSSKSVKILLRSGALIDHQDTLGRTALHVAATRGQAEVLQALIEAGATLDPRDNRHMTPLHYAVQQKDRRMMEMLLQTSININIQDNMGNTPLLMAVKIGDLAMVTLLVEKGADPFIENKQGSSSFLISLSYDTVMFLSKFLGHSSFQIFSWDNKVQALHWACKQGSPATLRLYLDQIPKTPEIRQQLVGAIHTAAKACRADLAKVLLSDDFQVDAIDIDGSTALLLACQAGRHGEVENYYQRVNLCKALILAGANIAARNNHNQTPVAIAKAHKDFELMTLLLNSARKLPANSSESEITQLTQSTLFFYKDAQYCKEAASFIGDETIEPELVRDAVKREQWDFVMTCIGGHFISKQDLGVDWEGQISGIRIGRLDELRFLCVQRNRDIVRYVFGKIHGCDSTVTHDPNTHLGLRNMEFEWHESKSRLMTIIWEEAMKPFGETLRAIERRPLDFEGQASISRDFVAFCRYAESDDDLPGRVGLGDRKGQSSSQETEQNGPDDALGSLAMNPNASLCPSDDSRQMDLNRHLDLPDISELVKVNWRYFDAARTVLYLHQQVEMSYILMKAWSKEFDKNGLERNDRTVYLWAQETLADIEKHCQQARDSLGLLKTCLQRELDAQPEKEGSSWNFLHHAARALDPHLNELLDDISWALDQLGMMKMEGKWTTKGLTDLCRKHMSRGIVMKAVSFLNGWGGKAWY